jgi:putative 4-mercaptohistidine N1-methyltranferase
MPLLFHVDHKVIAATTLAATFSLTAYSWYKYWSLKRKLKKTEVYETVTYLNEYLVFHYGLPDEVMPWKFGPKSDVDFPRRCAELCLKHVGGKSPTPHRALDIGCAVGRATFELTRGFDEVVGVDYSKLFVDTCSVLREKGQLGYSVKRQGELSTNLVAVIDSSIDRSKARFQRGDACSLPLDIGQFDCVLAANLIDRLHTPQAFLDRMPSLITKGGILVITSPYTIMAEFTTRENWIGGFTGSDGRDHSMLDALKERLEPNFELVTVEDLPFVIRETERKFQWTVLNASVWRRR